PAGGRTRPTGAARFWRPGGGPGKLGATGPGNGQGGVGSGPGKKILFPGRFGGGKNFTPPLSFPPRALYSSPLRSGFSGSGGRGVGRFRPDRLDLQLRGRHRGRIQPRLPPGHFQGQLGEIDDAPVPAVTTLIVRRTHVDAIDRTRIDTQGTKHALGIVDFETVDPKTLALRVLDLLDIDAAPRTGTGTPVATNASGQIETMKAAVAGLDRHRPLGVFELLRERLALVGLEEIPQGNVHALPNRFDRQVDI